MKTVYECHVCRKLYYDKEHALKCHNASYITRFLDEQTDSHVLETVLTTLLIEQAIESIAAIDTDNIDSNNFNGEGGTFGGAGANGSWEETNSDPIESNTTPDVDTDNSSSSSSSVD